MNARAELSALLASPALAEELFDLVPDVVFCVKDTEGRYRAVNQSLVERCGRRFKSELIGKSVHDCFPAQLAASYAAQDQQTLRTGVRIANKLELHLYPGGRTGWCLTHKLPLRGANGHIVGLAVLSRDLAAPDAARLIPASLGEAIDHLQTHFDGPLAPNDLAAKAGLSPVRFARLVKRIFQLSPAQLISQTRLQAAHRLLVESDRSIADVAVRCGYYDHSAFTRHFRAATGMTPLAFRRAGKAG